MKNSNDDLANYLMTATVKQGEGNFKPDMSSKYETMIQSICKDLSFSARVDRQSMLEINQLLKIVFVSYACSFGVLKQPLVPKLLPKITFSVSIIEILYDYLKFLSDTFMFAIDDIMDEVQGKKVSEFNKTTALLEHLVTPFTAVATCCDDESATCTQLGRFADVLPLTTKISRVLKQIVQASKTFSANKPANETNSAIKQLKSQVEPWITDLNKLLEKNLGIAHDAIQPQFNGAMQGFIRKIQVSEIKNFAHFALDVIILSRGKLKHYRQHIIRLKTIASRLVKSVAKLNNIFLNISATGKLADSGLKNGLTAIKLFSAFSTSYIKSNCGQDSLILEHLEECKKNFLQDAETYEPYYNAATNHLPRETQQSTMFSNMEYLKCKYSTELPFVHTVLQIASNFMNKNYSLGMNEMYQQHFNDFLDELNKKFNSNPPRNQSIVIYTKAKLEIDFEKFKSAITSFKSNPNDPVFQDGVIVSAVTLVLTAITVDGCPDNIAVALFCIELSGKLLMTMLENGYDEVQTTQDIHGLKPIGTKLLPGFYGVCQNAIQVLKTCKDFTISSLTRAASVWAQITPLFYAISNSAEGASKAGANGTNILRLQTYCNKYIENGHNFRLAITNMLFQVGSSMTRFGSQNNFDSKTLKDAIWSTSRVLCFSSDNAGELRNAVSSSLGQFQSLYNGPDGLVAQAIGTNAQAAINYANAMEISFVSIELLLPSLMLSSNIRNIAAHNEAIDQCIQGHKPIINEAILLALEFQAMLFTLMYLAPEIVNADSIFCVSEFIYFSGKYDMGDKSAENDVIDCSDMCSSLATQFAEQCKEMEIEVSQKQFKPSKIEDPTVPTSPFFVPALFDFATREVIQSPELTNTPFQELSDKLLKIIMQYIQRSEMTSQDEDEEETIPEIPFETDSEITVRKAHKRADNEPAIVFKPPPLPVLPSVPMQAPPISEPPRGSIFSTESNDTPQTLSGTMTPPSELNILPPDPLATPPHHISPNVSTKSSPAFPPIESKNLPPPAEFHISPQMPTSEPIKQPELTLPHPVDSQESTTSSDPSDWQDESSDSLSTSTSVRRGSTIQFAAVPVHKEPEVLPPPPHSEPKQELIKPQPLPEYNPPQLSSSTSEGVPNTMVSMPLQKPEPIILPGLEPDHSALNSMNLNSGNLHSGKKKYPPPPKNQPPPPPKSVLTEKRKMSMPPPAPPAIRPVPQPMNRSPNEFQRPIPGSPPIPTMEDTDSDSESTSSSSTTSVTEMSAVLPNDMKPFDSEHSSSAKPSPPPIKVEQQYEIKNIFTPPKKESKIEFVPPSKMVGQSLPIVTPTFTPPKKIGSYENSIEFSKIGPERPKSVPISPSPEKEEMPSILQKPQSEEIPPPLTTPPSTESVSEKMEVTEHMVPQPDTPTASPAKPEPSTPDTRTLPPIPPMPPIIGQQPKLPPFMPMSQTPQKSNLQVKDSLQAFPQQPRPEEQPPQEQPQMMQGPPSLPTGPEQARPVFALPPMPMMPGFPGSPPSSQGPMPPMPQSPPGSQGPMPPMPPLPQSPPGSQGPMPPLPQIQSGQMPPLPQIQSGQMPPLPQIQSGQMPPLPQIQSGQMPPMPPMPHSQQMPPLPPSMHKVRTIPMPDDEETSSYNEQSSSSSSKSSPPPLSLPSELPSSIQPTSMPSSLGSSTMRDEEELPRIETHADEIIPPMPPRQLETPPSYYTTFPMNPFNMPDNAPRLPTGPSPTQSPADAPKVNAAVYNSVQPMAPPLAEAVKEEEKKPVPQVPVFVTPEKPPAEQFPPSPQLLEEPPKPQTPQNFPVFPQQHSSPEMPPMPPMPQTDSLPPQPQPKQELPAMPAMPPMPAFDSMPLQPKPREHPKKSPEKKNRDSLAMVLPAMPTMPTLNTAPPRMEAPKMPLMPIDPPKKKSSSSSSSSDDESKEYDFEEFNSKQQQQQAAPPAVDLPPIEKSPQIPRLPPSPILNMPVTPPDPKPPQNPPPLPQMPQIQINQIQAFPDQPQIEFTPIDVPEITQPSIVASPHGINKVYNGEPIVNEDITTPPNELELKSEYLQPVVVRPYTEAEVLAQHGISIKNDVNPPETLGDGHIPSIAEVLAIINSDIGFDEDLEEIVPKFEDRLIPQKPYVQRKVEPMSNPPPRDEVVNYAAPAPNAVENINLNDYEIIDTPVTFGDSLTVKQPKQPIPQYAQSQDYFPPGIQYDEDNITVPPELVTPEFKPQKQLRTSSLPPFRGAPMMKPDQPEDYSSLTVQASRYNKKDIEEMGKIVNEIQNYMPGIERQPAQTEYVNYIKFLVDKLDKETTKVEENL